MAKDIFEVQTYTVCDGWINVWSEEMDCGLLGVNDVPQTFDTEREAEAAIYEFFADLSRAGISQSYDMNDYRVRKVTESDPLEGQDAADELSIGDWSGGLGDR